MFEYTSHVRFSESDPELLMTPSAVIARLEDAAVFHSEVSHVPVKPVAEMKEAWMVVSWQVTFSRVPRFNEEITTRTWTTHFHGFAGDRDFTVKGNDGEILIAANSRWVYMDLKKQLPMRVPQEVADAYGMEEPLPMKRAPRKIALPHGTAPETGESVRMTVSSLDNNGHVNNLEYVRIAVGYLKVPLAQIREMRVEYKAQAHLGDLLTPQIFRTEHEIYVSLVNGEQTPCAIVLFMIN